MKKVQLLAVMLTIFSSAAFGQTLKVESLYTSLSTRACKTIESNPDEGGSYLGVCPGAGGYKLELLEGDIRQTINVLTPNKKKYELNLWSVVSSGFSSVGEKAEWRVTRNGKTVVPNALILRFNASEDPEDSTKITSYLVVVKITKTEACVTNVVKPSTDQNIKARELADTSFGKYCKTNE
jgi:hypothetical protein